MIYDDDHIFVYHGEQSCKYHIHESTCRALSFKQFTDNWYEISKATCNSNSCLICPGIVLCKRQMIGNIFFICFYGSFQSIIY